jgi:apolipoprotein D and lipocalin family protein
MIHLQKAAILLTCIILGGCLGIPERVQPVQDFELERYLGQWYEVARLDHSFERGLEQVTAEYSMREDGGVTVTNRGYSIENDEWQEATGKAFFVNATNEGYLKVSFFGPFYGSYVVFEIDRDNYQYAYVSGPDTSYLWLLARTPRVSDAIAADFTAQAKKRGFDARELIWVRH